MQAAFLSGEDFHTVTAAQVFGVPVAEVTPLMRRNAKAVNFGIVYGISDWALAEDLGVSVAEARAFIQGYLERYITTFGFSELGLSRIVTQGNYLVPAEDAKPTYSNTDSENENNTMPDVCGPGRLGAGGCRLQPDRAAGPGPCGAG